MKRVAIPLTIGVVIVLLGTLLGFGLARIIDIGDRLDIAEEDRDNLATALDSVRAQVEAGDEEPVAPAPEEIIEGERGDTGPAGPPGPRGEAGRDGDDGLDGLPGLPGEPGAVGATGATGAAGPAGAQGAAGQQGEPGPAGPQGEPGTPGPAGADGAAGPPGPTCPPGFEPAMFDSGPFEGWMACAPVGP